MAYRSLAALVGATGWPTTGGTWRCWPAAHGRRQHVRAAVPGDCPPRLPAVQGGRAGRAGGDVPGQSRLTTPRSEDDDAEILS
eukprot:ctg_528.g247